MNAIEIDSMPVAPKLRLMEALWESLSQTLDAPDSEAAPDWHAQALQEAETALRAGRAEFIDWQAAKQILSARSRA